MVHINLPNIFAIITNYAAHQWGFTFLFIGNFFYFLYVGTWVKQWSRSFWAGCLKFPLLIYSDYSILNQKNLSPLIQKCCRMLLCSAHQIPRHTTTLQFSQLDHELFHERQSLMQHKANQSCHPHHQIPSNCTKNSKKHFYNFFPVCYLWVVVLVEVVKHIRLCNHTASRFQPMNRVVLIIYFQISTIGKIQGKSKVINIERWVSSYCLVHYTHLK